MAGPAPARGNWPCPFSPGYHAGVIPGRETRAAVIQARKNSVAILQVTDPHLFADPASSLRGTVTRAALQAVLDDIVASNWPADVVSMTGDLIQDDSAAAYQRFLEAFEPLGLPVYCVPGNHDVIDLMRDAVSSPPFHYCDSYRNHDWLMLGLDSCKPGSAGGHVSNAEMARAEAAIAATGAKHVLVCLHHPPLPMGSRWLDRVGLDNGPEFLRMLAQSGKVRGCLFGHVHQAFDRTWESIRILGTPSTCRQFMPGSDDFALDDRSPAYRRVLLHADGSIEDELVWVELPEAARSA